MKYGQVWSAHWEGAVGEWLRGQLDARGIDAPAYGRYVLSLLTKPLDPADLSPSPIGNLSWERRMKPNLAPLQLEALKRSEAVQCLVNASDDTNSGIEQLVDELCTKLKEAEAVNAKRGGHVSKISRKEKSKTLSPSEMARLYYAAFPALVPGDEASAAPASLPNRQTIKDTPVPRKNGSKDFLRAKHRQQLQQQYQGTKERRNTFHVHRKQNRNTKRREKCKSRDRGETLPEWITDEDVWDMDAQDPIKDFIKNTTDEGYGTCDNTTVEELISSKRLFERDAELMFNDNFNLCNNWNVYDSGFTSERDQKMIDESIARFEAKFDRSLEALWSKDQSNTPYDEYQDLPMDFQDLLSSPSDRMFEYSPRNKTFSSLLSNSIWSNSDMTLNGSKESFQPLFNYDYPGMENLSDVAKNVWEKEKNNMEVIYNKLQPLNLDDTVEATTDAKSLELWNKEVLELEAEEETYSHNYYQDIMNSVPAVTTNLRSLTALNHSRLYSSFTEVIPKASSGYVGDGILRKNHNNNNYKFEIAKPICSVTYSDVDDDNLLHSVRTHFQPINVQNGIQYKDGMTFPIDSELDEVQFYRSSSGTMFLESNSETPKEYMEYRRPGVDYSRLDLSSICSDDDLTSNDLVLKFKVCQNEKSVQTEPQIDDEIAAALSPRKVELSADNILEKCAAGSDTDVELEYLQQNWNQCEDCKLNNNTWIKSEWHPQRDDMNKIWSSEDNSCKACFEQRKKAKNKITNRSSTFKEDYAKEWDELFTDINFAQNMKDENAWYDKNITPDDGYILAPEISYKAADGNYIKGIQSRGLQRASVGDGDSKRYTVSYILDQSLSMYTDVEAHCEACADDLNISDSGGWKGDRKRRHSAAGGGSVTCTAGPGKLRCTLAAPPPALRPLHARLLSAAERPLTR